MAPLAAVIKQRVRCTEAKLIWSFDDKRTTFIPPSHSLDGWTEGGEEDQQREGENENSLRDGEIITSATYMSTPVAGSLVMFVLHFQTMKSHPISSTAAKSYCIEFRGQGVPEDFF